MKLLVDSHVMVWWLAQPERLSGEAVEALEFERELMVAPVLSPAHYRGTIEATAAPLRKLVESLRDNPARLAQFREIGRAHV